jgi:hypothetical protein
MIFLCLQPCRTFVIRKMNGFFRGRRYEVDVLGDEWWEMLMFGERAR